MSVCVCVRERVCMFVYVCMDVCVCENVGGSTLQFKVFVFRVSILQNLLLLVNWTKVKTMAKGLDYLDGLL